MKYRKKPVIAEAYQTDKEIIIHTLEGDMKANVGDYIITGVNGEQYPCKPDIFEKTYEMVGRKQVSDNKVVIEAYKEFAERIIDKRINTAKYGEVVLLTDIYDTLKELGCENGET